MQGGSEMTSPLRSQMAVERSRQRLMRSERADRTMVFVISIPMLYRRLDSTDMRYGSTFSGVEPASLVCGISLSSELARDWSGTESAPGVSRESLRRRLHTPTSGTRPLTSPSCRVPYGDHCSFLHTSLHVECAAQQDEQITWLSTTGHWAASHFMIATPHCPHSTMRSGA